MAKKGKGEDGKDPVGDGRGKVTEKADAQDLGFDTSNGKDMRLSFFIMPIHFLKAIREEYERLSGKEKAVEMLFNVGFRCGQTMTEKMSIEKEEDIDLAETLIALWIEVGLGRLQIHEEGAGTIIIISDDSTEAMANGVVGNATCDMTRGFIVGIASTIINKPYECHEEKCYSEGDQVCKYILKPKA
jgi:predicted hydrocarbon binding protein